MASFDTPSIEWHAGHDAIKAAVAGFITDTWTDAVATDADNDRFVAEYTGSGTPYTIRLFTWELTATTAGEPAPNTTLRMEADFGWDRSPSEAETDAATAHATRLRDALEAKLQRDVPPLWSAATASRAEHEGALVSLATIAADHFGNPEIFRALVEKAVWIGRITADSGTSMHAKIELGNYVANDADQYLEIELLLDSDDLAGLSIDAADELLGVVVEELYERLELQLQVSPPTVRRVELTADNQATPSAFYGSSDAIESYLSRLGVTDAPWKDGNRVVIMAPDAATRVELRLELGDSGAGLLETHVSLAIERVDAALAPEECAAWQAIADNAATHLAQLVANEAVAPSFTMRAPGSAVVSMLRTQLRQCFPSDSIQESDDGTFSVGGFDMGSDVFGQVSISVVAVGDLETRITFTGNVWGSGLTERPHALEVSRRDYRDGIARMATQIRDEMNATLDPLPPERPDMGLD